jgi:hypothetical protein
MWILFRRPPVRCNAPDSCAGQALRTGGALLIGAGVEWSAGSIVAREQAALIAHARVPLENWWTVTGQRTKWMRWRVEGSCRIRFLNVTVLSLRTIR